METFSWILLIIAALYGGLTIFAGITQLKGSNIGLSSSLIMIIGGVLIILSSFPSMILGSYTIILLILGLIMIHISAINNGLKMYGKINIKHHIVRLALSILIVAIFLLK